MDAEGDSSMDQYQHIELLTPRTVVEVIGARYVPGVHGSLPQS